MAVSDQFRIWSNELERDAVRLVAFQRWLAIELQQRLVWPSDQAKAMRQIGQVGTFIEHAVADLGRHGFFFRASDLRDHLIGQLDHIAAYQRKGGVQDLFGYLKSCWSGWVGKQAEKLAKAAREKRCHRNQVPDRRVPSMPEIVLRDLEARNEEIKSKRLFRTTVRRARKGPCNDPAASFLPGFQLPTKC